jgi:hypothetical protein
VRVDDSFLRINCGGPEVIEANTNIQWLGDLDPSSWFNGGLGFVEPTSPSIDRSADPSIPLQVMQSQRFTRDSSGDFRLAVGNGRFDVFIYVAEIWGGARVAGVRNFALSVEGQVLDNDIDPTRDFGFLKMGILVARNVAVNDGVLTVTLRRGSADNPAVNAIRVRPGTPCSGSSQCGVQCCAAGQTCQNGVCGTSGPTNCDPPFVASGGKCVFPTTPGICPRNEVDCAKGCATLGTTTNPATVCQGGTCENGVCVTHRPTAAEIASIRARIATFVTNSIQTEASQAATNPAVRVGDFIGGCTRLMFHDSGPARRAAGCAFVRDQSTASCNGRACEFTSDHNVGLARSIQIIHDFYNDQAFWPLISLQDFIYLFGLEALRVVSSGQVTSAFRTGRAPCQCLLTRPFSACANPPNFPDSMPEAEHSFAQLKTVMETQMGFTEHEWMCLTGAHAMGRAMRSNTGYGGPWTSTPGTFSSQYWQTMNTDQWVSENGVVSTNEDIPAVGKKEFRLPGTNRMMLRSDMAPYWDIETNPNCPVTHGVGTGFCPPREPQFTFMNTLLNPTTFFGCFNPAFQKMCELGNPTLNTPS